MMIYTRFLLQQFLTWEACGLELASTITFVLQAKQLTRCASVQENRVLSIAVILRDMYFY